MLIEIYSKLVADGCPPQQSCPNPVLPVQVSHAIDPSLNVEKKLINISRFLSFRFASDEEFKAKVGFILF
jgi:hypothetical protein